MQRLFFTLSATESEIISCKDSYLQKQFDKYTFQSYDDYIVKNIKYDHFRAARSICAAAKGGTMEYRRFDNTIIARIDKGHVFGGHLNEATVSATCEMVIQIIDGKVDRYFDEEIGLNLFRF